MTLFQTRLIVLVLFRLLVPQNFSGPPSFTSAFSLMRDLPRMRFFLVRWCSTTSFNFQLSMTFETRRFPTLSKPWLIMVVCSCLGSASNWDLKSWENVAYNLSNARAFDLSRRAGWAFPATTNAAELPPQRGMIITPRFSEVSACGHLCKS